MKQAIVHCFLAALHADGIRNSVRQRFQIFAILFAWFMAAGAEWDLVQTFGWARMMVNYSRTMPVWDAVEHTFDGKMCNVCRAVNQAKHQQEIPVSLNGKPDTKIIFVLLPAPHFIAPILEIMAWSPDDFLRLDGSRAAPPTPPPRV